MTLPLQKGNIMNPYQTPPFTTHIKHESRDGMWVTEVAVVDSKGYTISHTTDEVPLEWVREQLPPAPAPAPPRSLVGYTLRSLTACYPVVAHHPNGVSVQYPQDVYLLHFPRTKLWVVNHERREIFWCHYTMSVVADREGFESADFVPLELPVTP